MLESSFLIDYFALSDIGLVREQNEDAWNALPEKGIFLIADGMGGHQGGEVAALLSIEELTRLLSQEKILQEQDLRQAFSLVNQFIYERAKTEESLAQMGTTLTCLLLQKNSALFAHVGDSRLYLFRENKLLQLTKDHSFVSELIDMGAMTQEESVHFPYKHILTKAVGTASHVEASTGSIEVKSLDLFLLATDGLTNFLSQEHLVELLTEKSSLEECAASLVHEAKANGGGDNITVVLVRVQ